MRNRMLHAVSFPVREEGVSFKSIIA